METTEQPRDNAFVEVNFDLAGSSSSLCPQLPMALEDAQPVPFPDHDGSTLEDVS